MRGRDRRTGEAEAPREAGLCALGEGVVVGTDGGRNRNLRPGASTRGVHDAGTSVVENEGGGVVPGHRVEGH